MSALGLLNPNQLEGVRKAGLTDWMARLSTTAVPRPG